MEHRFFSLLSLYNSVARSHINILSYFHIISDIEVQWSSSFHPSSQSMVQKVHTHIA